MTSAYDTDRNEMLAFVPQGVATVLDVGCDTGRFGAALIERHLGVDVRVFGVEPQATASAFIDRYETVWRGTFPDAVPEGQRFDCIVMNDVIEHMVDPWSALETARSLLSGPRVLVGSVPNIRNVAVLKELLVAGDFRYEETGILDQTHLRFFTDKSLRRTLTDSGFVVERTEPISMPQRTLAHRLIKKYGGPTGREFITRQLAFVARPG